MTRSIQSLTDAGIFSVYKADKGYKVVNTDNNTVIYSSDNYEWCVQYCVSAESLLRNIEAKLSALQ